MAKFKKLIYEIALNELGSTTDAYDYYLEREPDAILDKVEWKFKTPEHTYLVKGQTEGKYIKFEFTATDAMGMTREGNQFNVIATIMKIAKETWERREELFLREDLWGFKYYPITKPDEPDSKDTTARDKLYQTFIRNQFPGAEIDQGEYETTVEPKQ